jgi:hypothetical protein
MDVPASADPVQGSLGGDVEDAPAEKRHNHLFQVRIAAPNFLNCGFQVSIQRFRNPFGSTCEPHAKAERSDLSKRLVRPGSKDFCPPVKNT